MKILHSILLTLAVLLIASCSNNSHIPDISIFEEIPSDKLAEALKAEEGKHFPRGQFEEIYPGVRKQLESMSEIDKAKVAHLTYRELINAMDVMNDSVAAKEIHDEWQAIYDSHIEEAKRLASQKSTGFEAGARVAATRSYMNGGDFRVSDYARRSPEYKYMSRVPAALWEIDNCWDLSRIIKYDIDPNFESEYVYCGRKQLARIEDKYPEAHYFLSIHQQKVEEYFHGMKNIMR